jgi:hypothetical protein
MLSRQELRQTKLMGSPNSPMLKVPAMRTSRMARASLVQRKCACGTHVPGGGECPECTRKRLQRKANNCSAGGNTSPATTCRASAPPQREAILNINESGYEHDFSGTPSHFAAISGTASHASLEETGVVHQHLRGPLLQRQRNPDVHPTRQDGGQQKPAETHTESTDGRAVDSSGTPTIVPVGASTCSPVGKARADFLKEPNVTTNDFGLTRLDVNAVTFPAFSAKRKQGGFAIEPTTAALPVIQSVFTDAGVFTEGDAHFISQNGGDCPSAKLPIRWIIAPGGATSIKQGEQEHCEDFQLAFDLSLKRYAAAVNALAGRRFPSETAAERAVTRITGVAPKDWVSVFLCLARKTKLRDGTGPGGWHTPRPMMRPPQLATNCDHVTALVQASSLPQVGQHPSPEIIKDCGETGKQSSGGATRRAQPHTQELRSPGTDEHARIQRKPVAEPSTPSWRGSVAEVLATPGHTLNEATRTFMNPRFGFDFSRVRVHVDSSAARSAEALNALAYTVGTHVVFAAGRYEPNTSTGLHLLAHELAHVVQQNASSTVAHEVPEIDVPDDAAEQEADTAAARVMANARSGELPAHEGPVLQCQRLGDDAAKKPLEKEDAGAAVVGGLKAVAEQAKDNNPKVKQVVIDPIKDRLKGGWNQLGTGEKAGVIGVGAAALGTAGGAMLSDPAGRKQLAGVNLAAPLTLIPYMPLSSFKYTLPSGNTPDTRLLKFDTAFNADDLINLHTTAHGLPKMSLSVDMQWGYDPTTERLRILGGDAKLGLVPGLSISAGAYKDILRPPQTVLGPEGQATMIKQSLPGGPKPQPIPDVRVMVSVDLLKFKPGDLVRQIKGIFGR